MGVFYTVDMEIKKPEKRNEAWNPSYGI